MIIIVQYRGYSGSGSYACSFMITTTQVIMHAMAANIELLFDKCMLAFPDQ